MCPRFSAIGAHLKPGEMVEQSSTDRELPKRPGVMKIRTAHSENTHHLITKLAGRTSESMPRHSAISLLTLSSNDFVLERQPNCELMYFTDHCS